MLPVWSDIDPTYYFTASTFDALILWGLSPTMSTHQPVQAGFACQRSRHFPSIPGTLRHLQSGLPRLWAPFIALAVRHLPFCFSPVYPLCFQGHHSFRVNPGCKALIRYFQRAAFVCNIHVRLLYCGRASRPNQYIYIRISSPRCQIPRTHTDPDPIRS